MKGSGLIIEDDSPKSKKPAAKNPFSFFAPKPGASSAAGRAPAPYSIFDESATSPPTAPKTAKGTAAPSNRPAHPVGGAPPPSIFDDPPILPSAGAKPKRAAPASVAAPHAKNHAGFDAGDGFDLMKERLAEQEKLKRRAKEQLQTTATGGVASSGGSKPRSTSTVAPTASKSKKKDNPFSFKNFATRGDEEKDMDDDAEEEEESGTGGGDDDGDEEEEEQARPGENPFSFKAFAKKSADGKSHQQPQQQRPRKATKAPALPSLSDDDDDDENEGIGSVGSDRRKTKKENPYSFAALATSTPSPPPPSTKTTSLPLPAISESEDEDEDEDEDNIGIPSLRASHTVEAPDLDVPDFSVESSDRRGGDNSDAESRLSAQVAELKALLLRAEAKADEERKRAEAIERRALKAEKAQARLRKKEEDDTKQLNDVVQAIEHNLMLATARAEKAEAKVQQLEDQAARCSCGRGAGHGHGGDNSEAQQQLRTIHEQSAYLTAQLHQAANDAEAGIKKLIGGVSTLRDIATVLQSIDKLSHLPADS